MTTHDTIETERRRYIDQLIEDATAPTRLNHEGRTAAILLALDMLDPAQAGIRYFKVVGDTIVTAQITPEACRLSFEVQALIDELNAS